MANKGLRFFSTDYAEASLGGTTNSSSRTDFAEFAFDGLEGTKWTSENQNTDGEVAWVEMDFGIDRTIDSFFVYQTNIEDVEIQYYDDDISSWVTCNDSIATIVQSGDTLNLFVILDNEITTQKIRVVGSDTITPDEEKYVTLLHAFQELGQFQYFPEFKPKYTPLQNVFQTSDGRGFVIERGEQFSAQLEFKSHINQNDIDLIEELIARKTPFFIWPNGGDEDIFKYSFKPYRFQDLIKVAIVGNSSPSFTRNYYRSGYNNTINLIEVV